MCMLPVPARKVRCTRRLKRWILARLCEAPVRQECRGTVRSSVFGQDRLATLMTDRTPKGLFNSDAGRVIYFGNSAEAVVQSPSRL